MLRPLVAARSSHTRLAVVTLAVLGIVAVAQAAGRPTVAAQPPDPLADAAWRALASAGPRAGHDAVVDFAARRMLVHGGESALFTPATTTAWLDLVAGGWSDLPASPDAPVARLEGRGILGGALVLDADERLLLAQCDCQDGSAFVLDLERDRWAAAPNDSDVPYVDVLAAYDAAADRGVFFGGAFRGLDEPSPTAFAYDLSPARAGWAALPDVPFLLQFQAFDRDDATGHLLAFGGQTAEGAATAQLWRLDLALADQEGAWVELLPGAEDAWPTPRIGATLTFMAGTGRALLFGGYDLQTGVSFDDLWLLDARDPDRPRWTAVDLPDGPSARSGHSAAWDPVGQALIVHGGVTVAANVPTYFGDTWALELAPAEATATPSPSPTSATATPTASAEPPSGRPVFLPVAYNRFTAKSP